MVAIHWRLNIEHSRTTEDNIISGLRFRLACSLPTSKFANNHTYAFKLLFQLEQFHIVTTFQLQPYTLKAHSAFTETAFKLHSIIHIYVKFGCNNSPTPWNDFRRPSSARHEEMRLCLFNRVPFSPSPSSLNVSRPFSPSYPHSIVFRTFFPLPPLRHTVYGRPSTFSPPPYPTLPHLSLPSPRDIKSKLPASISPTSSKMSPGGDRRGKSRFHLASNLTSETWHFIGQPGISLPILSPVGFHSSRTSRTSNFRSLFMGHLSVCIIKLFT